MVTTITIKYRNHENMTTFPAHPEERQPMEDDPDQLGVVGWEDTRNEMTSSLCI